MLESSAIIKNEIGELNPEIAVILGSGLENFFTKDNITNSISVSYTHLRAHET